MPFAYGTFALYDQPDGGIVVVTEMAGPDGVPRVQRHSVPAVMVKLMRKRGKMVPGELVG